MKTGAFLAGTLSIGGRDVLLRLGRIGHNPVYLEAWRTERSPLD